MSLTARMLDVSPEQYHLLPHFSATTAKTLDQRSPLHAWHEHPAFGGAGKPHTALLDRGAAIHTFTLGKGKRLACLPYDSWRTDAAKESRDKTRAAGMVPLLHGDYTDYENASSKIRVRLEESGHFLSDAVGQAECAIEWQEPSSVGPVTCKCMLDFVNFHDGSIYELKVVDDAHPERCERTAENLGYSIQAAAYIRALLALHPDLAGRISFRFLFCEPNEPYALHDPEPDPMFLESGERKWLRAVEQWGRALKSGVWPHYQDTRYISRPRWALAKEGIRSDEW